MLHHDCAYNPTEAQLGIVPGKKTPASQKSVVNQAAHVAFLEEHPLEKISEADLDLVCVWGEGLGGGSQMEFIPG